MFILLFSLLLFSGCFEPNPKTPLVSCRLYSLQEKTTQNNQVKIISKNKKPLTRYEFIQQLNNKDLQKLLNQDICSQSQPIYFETTKLSQDTKDDVFHYSLTPAPQLKNAQANITTFAQNSAMIIAVQNNELVTSFENISKSSMLIVPTLINDHILNKAHYISLYHFIKHAPKKEIEQFWSKWSAETQKQLQQNKTIWMSTHGTGVHWLHGRLDTTPKYYSSTLKHTP